MPASSPGKLIPRLEGGLPFLGHAVAFLRNPVSLLRQAQQRHGDVFSFTLFGQSVTALIGPSGNEAFFKAPDDVLNPKAAYRFMVPIFGKGVAYDVSPELMDYQLGLLHPALRDQRMQSYAQVMAAEAEAHLDSWGDEGEVDLLAAMNEITIYVAGRCLIGSEFRRRLSAEFVRLYHDLEGGINMVAFFAPYLPLPAMRRRDRARRRVVELISGLIADRRSGASVDDDFLATLIDARDPAGQPLSDDTITGLLLTLLFAGQHTSAVLATWTGILLLQNQGSAEAVLDEQTSVFERQGMTLAALKQLVCLERCIKEAERLYPPLVMLMRKATQDFAFGDHVIPAGSLVLVSPAVSHLVPTAFADPLRYDPDRFAPGREEDRRTPYSLIGFGGGKHRCIGLAFAYQQVKVIWSVLLKRYELSLASDSYQPNYATFVVGPRQPCMVRYRRRSSSEARPLPAAVRHAAE
jgi:sterol 14-demethylase